MATATHDFTQFKRAVKETTQGRTPLDPRAYSRWGYSMSNPVSRDFTLEEIQEIIRSGDLLSLRQLSRYFYRVNSNYRQSIDFLANLPLYDTMVIPIYQEGKGSKTQIVRAFYDACNFVEALDLPNSLSHITKEWMKNGIYYGILRENGQGCATIQDLPLEYCRSRFKDFHNLAILEFNLTYFDRLTDEDFKLEALNSFPTEVQDAYNAWKSRKRTDPWVSLPAGSGGIAFFFSGDCTPPLIASIPELKKLDDATKREGERDEQELCKLLIQQMPIDSAGELVFPLEEVAEIHSSVAAMLQALPNVDVLTTFGETSLENLQDSTAASQANDRLEKYRQNAYDSLGKSEILFNAEGSASLSYSIKKDEALVSNYLNVYETWIDYLLNERFARKGLTFDFEILPTTVFNRSEIQNSIFKGSQYGYSKMRAGISLGMKQLSQLSLMDFENNILKMSERMIPLQSSYTTPGNQIVAESSGGTTNSGSKNEGLEESSVGRPRLADGEASEKTIQNRASQEK